MAQNWSKKTQKAHENAAKNEPTRRGVIDRARIHDAHPPIVRSPALESAEKDRTRRGDIYDARNDARNDASARRSTPRPYRNANSVRYAAEETLARPTPRKSLPRQKNILDRA